MLKLSGIKLVEIIRSEDYLNFFSRPKFTLLCTHVQYSVTRAVIYRQKKTLPAAVLPFTTRYFRKYHDLR